MEAYRSLAIWLLVAGFLACKAQVYALSYYDSSPENYYRPSRYDSEPAPSDYSEPQLTYDQRPYDNYFENLRYKRLDPTAYKPPLRTPTEYRGANGRVQAPQRPRDRQPVTADIVHVQLNQGTRRNG